MRPCSRVPLGLPSARFPCRPRPVKRLGCGWGAAPSGVTRPHSLGVSWPRSLGVRDVEFLFDTREGIRAEMVLSSKYILCVFAMVGLAVAALFAALAKEAKQRLGEFCPHDLANSAWAVATVGLVDVTLFAALAQGAKQRLGELNPQDLANTAWALQKDAM